MLRKESYYHELVGKRQGKITIIKEVETRPRKGKMWLCRCDCGEEFLASTGQINGGRKYCVNCAKEMNAKRSREQLSKHKGSKTRLYKLWMSMKSRCNYKGDTNYHHYGARGIAVCEEWNNNYEAFRDWAIANGYSDNLSIDRIDENGNYEPSNCQWVPLEKQKYHKRSARMIDVNGEAHLLTEWARIIGVNHSAIIQAERRGQSVEEYIKKKLGGIHL